MKLSQVFGISPEDAARLEQANVRTLRDLSAIPNLAALSVSTSIPVDFLERWHAAAAARIAARRQQRAIVSVVALLTAFLVGGIALWSHKKGISPSLDQAIAEFNRGNALSNEGKFDAAADAYRKALAIKPDYAEAKYNLGAALRNAGHYDAAADHYRQALAVNPFDPGSHNGLGDVYFDEGKFNDAITEQERAVALVPAYTFAWFDLALALREKYVRETPPNVATLRQLIYVLDKILELQGTRTPNTCLRSIRDRSNSSETGPDWKWQDSRPDRLWTLTSRLCQQDSLGLPTACEALAELVRVSGNAS